jgi:Domain of unknown function (DUF4136)
MCNCSFSVHLVGSREKKSSTLDSQLSIPLDSGEMIPQNFLSGRITRTKWNARIALTLAMVAFTSCSTVTVRTEHDPGTHFAGYRTYAFGPPSPNVLALSPSVRTQIESSLNQGLTARGLHQAARPDFYVSYHVTTREQISEQTFHDWGPLEPRRSRLEFLFPLARRSDYYELRASFYCRNPGGGFCRC